MPSECKQPFHQLKIQMDGNVYACSNGQLVGNLKFLTAEEIWNGREIKELRERLITDNYDEMCLNCPLFKNKKKIPFTLFMKSIIKKYLSFFKKTIKKLINPKELEFKKLTEKDNLIYINGKLLEYKQTSELTIENESIIRDKVTISGWVIDRKTFFHPTHIVALIDGKYNNHSKINILRDDVLETFKFKDKINLGFSLKIDKIINNDDRILLIFSNRQLIGKF